MAAPAKIEENAPPAEKSPPVDENQRRKEWESFEKEKDSDQSTAQGLVSLHGGCVKPDSVVVVLLGKQWYWTVVLPQHYACFDVMPKEFDREMRYQSLADEPLLALNGTTSVKLPQGRPVTFLIQNHQGPVHEFKLRRLNDSDTFPLMSYMLNGLLSSVGDILPPSDKGARFYALAFHELAQVEPERRSRQPPSPPFFEAAGYGAERILHADVRAEQAAWKVAEELRSVVPVGLLFEVVSAEEFLAFASSTR